jgi:NADPH-dependent curcumin reductase CurA
VIGTAGGPQKCRLVTERYGFDACIDYKQHNTVEAMSAALKAAAPDGVDLYFDNTGGHVTTAVFERFNRFGRMVLCGAIESYNKTPQENMIPNPFGLHTIYKSINIRGFVVRDFNDRMEEFYAEVPQLVKAGKIRYDETRYEGFEKIGEAFAGLFKGANTGKAVIIVSE